MPCGGAQASLIAFDLLRLDRDDLRLRPLEARRETLMWLVDGVDGIVFSQAGRREYGGVRQGVRTGPRRHRIEAARQIL
jgi:ATP-dependent DNA ligase